MNEKDDDDRPLMTPRSPSIERARREFEHPSPTGDPEVIALLDHLSEAEQNASRACAQAAQLLKDEDLAKAASDQSALHEQHRQALGKLVEHLGGSPLRPDECRQILTHDPASITRATSDDAVMQTLGAMRTELRALYASAMTHPRLDAHQRSILDLIGTI